MQHEYTKTRGDRVRAIARTMLPAPCHLCGQVVTSEQLWVAEHIIPRYQADEMDMPVSQQDSSSNVAVSHRTCSNRSGGLITAKRKAEKKSVLLEPVTTSALCPRDFISGSDPEPRRSDENSEIPAKREFRSIENDSGDFIAIPRTYSLIPEEETEIDISEVEALSIRYLTPPGDKPHAFKPQQRQIARVLQAYEDPDEHIPRFQRVVIQVPRRSAKTETIQAVLLWRALNIPGYLIIQTGQSYIKARATFLRMTRTLEQTWPDAPFRVLRGMGTESIQFENGSAWTLATPKASSFRGDPADCIFIDESGVFSEEQSNDLEEGAAPTQDTKPRAQMIIAGTPEIRGGLLWTSLTVARQDPETNGVVDYSMHPTDDPEDEDTWWKVHPGLASKLTTLKVIKQRFDRYPLASFCQEYLCADPLSSKDQAIPEQEWLDTTVDPFDIPEHASYGFATTYPSGAYAALVAAWYTELGEPHIAMVKHDRRTTVTKVIEKLLKDNPRAVVHYDAIGDNLSIANDLKRVPKLPIANLSAISVRQLSAGVSTLVAAVADKRLVHYAQKPLDIAANGASFRYFNDSRLFGRRSSIEDISPLEAAAIALEDASQKIPKQKVRVAAQTL